MNTTIHIAHGTLEGFEQDGVLNWRGIPYAQAPVGTRRYQAPQPMRAWSGVRDAKRFGAIPPQFPNPAENPPWQQSEDCLYLNVQAAKTSSSEPRAVMVWIYGGGYHSGHSNNPWYHHPALTTLEDVVLVTFNYRLGAFSCLELSDAPPKLGFASNLALLDQVAALGWVRENIAAFGGDPNRVTIFGESAGGTSVASLLAMPAARGLFQRAILQSPADMFLSRSEGLARTEAFLNEVGIGADRLEDLLSLSSETILQAGAKTMMPYGPIVGTPSLPLTPEVAIRQGSAARVALMIGTNCDEGHMWFTPESPIAWEFDAPKILGLLEGQYGQARASSIAARYPKTWQGYSQLVTDHIFWSPSVRIAEAQSAFAPVWMYRFDWSCPAERPFHGAFHALEMVYVFDCLQTPAALGFMGGRTGFQPLADQMRSSWGAFARGETPQASTLPEWTNYTTQDRMTLLFDEHCQMVCDPQSEARKIFND
jgi:para-nitrobenzyl esterase